MLPGSAPILHVFVGSDGQLAHAALRLKLRRGAGLAEERRGAATGGAKTSGSAHPEVTVNAQGLLFLSARLLTLLKGVTQVGERAVSGVFLVGERYDCAQRDMSTIKLYIVTILKFDYNI
jgi:hypothetical protein